MSFGTPLDAYPTGAVVWYHGDVADIPSGWNLCNGNNGTPDLQGYFMRSVPNTSTDPGTTGGTDFVTLSTSQIPSHDHTGSTASDDPGDHSHDAPSSPLAAQSGEGGSARARGTGNTETSTSAGGHTHTASMDSVGNANSIENRPAYTELIPIQKTQ